MRAKLDGMVGRLAELDGLLAAENATRDLEQFKRLAREHAEVTAGLAFQQLPPGGAGRGRGARDGGRARDEGVCRRGAKARAAMERLEAELQAALLPKDPNDERNLFIEVRAGTGGDESALFAGDLFRMYTRYAERKGLAGGAHLESPSELGGLRR